MKKLYEGEGDMEVSKEVTKVEGPKRTSKPAEHIPYEEIDGRLFAWDEAAQQPVLLRMPGSPYHYIALFSSKEKLETLMQEAEVAYDKIKPVMDGAVFLQGLKESPPEVWADTKIILDPYFTNEGRVRFTELMFDSVS